jgi:glycosyltransferase involved in cell wall biosynthesis
LKKNKQLKILNIITLFSIGGATETVVSMAEGLIKKGHTVHVATGPNIISEGSMYETAKEKNIPVHTFKNLNRAINPVRDLKIIFQLSNFIRKGKYDIVHTHSSKAGVVGRIAAWLALTPAIVHTVHGLPFHRYQPEVKKRTFIWIEKFSNLFCHKIVAVTQTIIDTMLGYNIGNPNKYVMIRSAFDTDIYKVDGDDYKSKTRQRFGIKKDDIVIGKIARLSPLKGHKYILNAFKQISNKNPKAKLLIVGNGELEYDLKRFVETNNLQESVIFTGLITPEEIPGIIEIMDILVHTSLLEGLARVLPQAIMMEKPVISFDLDGAHEVILDGKNGFLIRPEDEDQLAEKIIYLCNNSHLINQFGKFGKSFIGNQFCSSKMIEQIETLYIEFFNKSN